MYIVYAIKFPYPEKFGVYRWWIQARLICLAGFALGYTMIMEKQ